MNREIIKIDYNEVDITDTKNFDYEGELYIFVKSYPIPSDDGQETEIIIRRSSDNKTFSNSYSYNSGMYYFYEEWYEVKERLVTHFEYYWDEK